MSLTTGLVSYWKLDENSGTTAFDSVSTFDGVATSGVLGSAGKINNGGTFNGSSLKIETGRTVPNNNNVSFSVWMYDTSSSGIRIITADSGGGFFIMQVKTTGRTAFNIFSGGDRELLETNNHNKNQWYHYVGVLTGGIMYLYRDAVLQSSRVCGNIGNIANGLDFATNSNTGWFQGRLDEIGIWNRALTSTEITELYNSGVGLSYPFTSQSGAGFLMKNF